MDQNVSKLLMDKLYDKRKQGALELEKLIRDALAKGDQQKIKDVILQLCDDYAYTVHTPFARNGGLIGLAAAAIALGSEDVARFLPEIVPPVLACFTDIDARVRYYACEAMYNISKVAKGEVLVYFNSIFDALCKLSGDSELSVKNGAELLDRLIKDIVSESAANYVSILDQDDHLHEKESHGRISRQTDEPLKTAFSLEAFIPLLEERIHVLNPFTRQFLVSWLSLLDTIPDLELVHYLPSFLGGLLKFLGDQNRDVCVATHGLLDKLLSEIEKISLIKKGIAESRRSRQSMSRRRDSGSQSALGSPGGSIVADDLAVEDSGSNSEEDDDDDYDDSTGDWIPGQDIEIDYAAILDILLKFVDPSSNKDPSPMTRIEGLPKQKEEEIGIVALKWIAKFFELASEDILAIVPRLLGVVLPAMASQSEQFRVQAASVNHALMQYVIAYKADQADEARRSLDERVGRSQRSLADSANLETSQAPTQEEPVEQDKNVEGGPNVEEEGQEKPELDYAEAVRVLQLQLLHEREETRVAAITWLRLLHKGAPDKVLALHDGTFPVLLKTLSDASESVVTQDLALLSQLSSKSQDSYFSSFMEALLQLFSTDRKLLEIRGNLIIRQLCINLQPERIYRTFADCILRDDDVEFSSIMVQNLNNNLITAPELAELRKRLRNLDSKEGQAFFVALFKAWSHNAVATFSLCLLAQAYEQAYSLLQIFADLEVTVNMLIQIDKLVQLLESPVFTFLRIQLLEPERYPYLYKCLYGLLMLLPQSSAFAALKNRLNSVNAIALLHTPPPQPSSARPSYVFPHSSGPGHVRQRSSEKGLGLPLSLSISNTGSLTNSASSVAAGSGIAGSSTSSVGRLAGRREPGAINTSGEMKWSELMEKFKVTQDKARRRNDPRFSRFEDEGLTSIERMTGLGKEDTGRTSRTSGQPGETGRPGSRLSLEKGQIGPGNKAAGPHRTPQMQTQPRFERQLDTTSGDASKQGHKSRHSLFSKYGLRGNARDKDKDKLGGGGGSGGWMPAGGSAKR